VLLRVEVEVEKNKSRRSNRKKKTSRASFPSFARSLLSLFTFFLGTAIHRRCCCQSETWNGEARNAEGERRDSLLRRPPRINADSSPPQKRSIKPSVASLLVLVEGELSPLDAQGKGGDDWLEAAEAEEEKKAAGRDGDDVIDVIEECKTLVDAASALAWPNSSSSRAIAATEEADEEARARSMTMGREKR
jgi:hypothetical protein